MLRIWLMCMFSNISVFLKKFLYPEKYNKQNQIREVGYAWSPVLH